MDSLFFPLLLPTSTCVPYTTELPAFQSSTVSFWGNQSPDTKEVTHRGKHEHTWLPKTEDPSQKDTRNSLSGGGGDIAVHDYGLTSWLWKNVKHANSNGQKYTGISQKKRIWPINKFLILLRLRKMQIKHEAHFSYQDSQKCKAENLC